MSFSDEILALRSCFVESSLSDLIVILEVVFDKVALTLKGSTERIAGLFALPFNLSCKSLVASMSCAIWKLELLLWETMVCFSICVGGSFRERMLSILKEDDEGDDWVLLSTLEGVGGWSVSSELFSGVKSLSKTSRIFKATAVFSTSLFSLLPGLALVFSSLRSLALLFWNQT